MSIPQEPYLYKKITFDPSLYPQLPKKAREQGTCVGIAIKEVPGNLQLEVTGLNKTLWIFTKDVLEAKHTLHSVQEKVRQAKATIEAHPGKPIQSDAPKTRYTRFSASLPKNPSPPASKSSQSPAAVSANKSPVAVEGASTSLDIGDFIGISLEAFSALDLPVEPQPGWEWRVIAATATHIKVIHPVREYLTAWIKKDLDKITPLLIDPYKYEHSYRTGNTVTIDPDYFNSEAHVDIPAENWEWELCSSVGDCIKVTHPSLHRNGLCINKRFAKSSNLDASLKGESVELEEDRFLYGDQQPPVKKAA